MDERTVEAGTALAASLLRSSGPAGRAIRLGAAYWLNRRHGEEYAQAVQRVAIRLYEEAARTPG